MAATSAISAVVKARSTKTPTRSVVIFFPNVTDEPVPRGGVLPLEAKECPPLTGQLIAHLTKENPTLSKVYQGLQDGSNTTWKRDEFSPYKRPDLEPATQNGCLTWGARVVVPQAAREEALKILLANRPCILAMKGTARSHFRWPKLDSDIEATAAVCETCQKHQRANLQFRHLTGHLPLDLGKPYT